MKNEYIFLTGAPGSRWSSIAKVLYSSPDINTSDSGNSYTKPGESSPMHLGAYWDPGMEYGRNFERLYDYSPLEAQDEFDRPFTSDYGLKLIKSHQFAHNLEYISMWKCPIILAHRPNKTSYDWWLEAGGFDITYPSYEWYKNNIESEIASQNKHIENFVASRECLAIHDSSELAYALNIDIPVNIDFAERDTTVFLHTPRG